MMATVPVGRVGLTVDVLPAIFPVNFALLGEDVVIRTSWGTKLAAATNGQVVCFQADGFDADAKTGWSVLVTGQAEVISDDETLALVDELCLEPWAPVVRDHYVRIPVAMMSGRRILPSNGSVPDVA